VRCYLNCLGTSLIFLPGPPERWSEPFRQFAFLHEPGHVSGVSTRQWAWENKGVMVHAVSFATYRLFNPSAFNRGISACADVVERQRILLGRRDNASTPDLWPEA
jgi:hypothetical protein